MKLLVAVTQNADAGKLRAELNLNQFASTKLASTGGCLREGNPTFLIAVEDDKVWHLKELIRKTCKERSKLMPTAPYPELAESLFAEPLEVSIGGAVVFVLPLEEIVRL